VTEHHAATLGHAVNFALLDLEALFLADQRQRLRDQQHALAAEAGHFTMADVAAGLSAKLVRRHPHIFSDAKPDDPAAVQKTWDAVKAEEKKLAGTTPHGLLADVSRAMPAMTEARKLGAKAAKVGFDWPDPAGLIAKLDEEVAELKIEVEAGSNDAMEDELGDLLFTAVNLARHLKLDPETALRRANAKFRQRFDAMETAAGGHAVLAAKSPEELDARALYTEAAEYAITVHDRVTKELYDELLIDEEHHIDFLETQQELIRQVGVPLYSQKHIGGLKD